jgi:hypothetical protein
MKLIFPSKTLGEKINTRFYVKRDRENKNDFSLFLGSGVCVLRCFVNHESRSVFFTPIQRGSCMVEEESFSQNKNFSLII